MIQDKRKGLKDLYEENKYNIMLAFPILILLIFSVLILIFTIFPIFVWLIKILDSMRYDK